MEEFGLYEEVLENEWVDLPQAVLTHGNTGVECDTCGGVSLLKYHIARSGFSYTCNKCRRTQAKRDAQRRYAKRMYHAEKDVFAAMKADAMALLGKQIDSLQGKIDAMNETIKKQDFHLSPQQIVKNDSLRYEMRVLSEARNMVVKDLKRVRGKPYEDYVTAAKAKLQKGNTDGANSRRKSEGRDKEAAEGLWF